MAMVQALATIVGGLLLLVGDATPAGLRPQQRLQLRKWVLANQNGRPLRVAWEPTAGPSVRRAPSVGRRFGNSLGLLKAGYGSMVMPQPPSMPPQQQPVYVISAPAPAQQSMPPKQQTMSSYLPMQPAPKPMASGYPPAPKPQPMPPMMKYPPPQPAKPPMMMMSYPPAEPSGSDSASSGYSVIFIQPPVAEEPPAPAPPPMKPPPPPPPPKPHAPPAPPADDQGPSSYNVIVLQQPAAEEPAAPDKPAPVQPARPPSGYPPAPPMPPKEPEPTTGAESAEPETLFIVLQSPASKSGESADKSDKAPACAPAPRENLRRPISRYTYRVKVRVAR